MTLTTCARCQEPIEEPATLCTDCRVVIENQQEALRAPRLAAIPIVEREVERVKALEHLAYCVHGFLSEGWSTKYMREALDRIEAQADGAKGDE